jgi:hypothetical protein
VGQTRIRDSGSIAGEYTEPPTGGVGQREGPRRSDSMPFTAFTMEGNGTAAFYGQTTC